MSYQRLMWHSGLTYRGVCPACRRYVIYTDYNLGFRAWFPDGFVYCPTCRKPIRHNENNAIKPDGTPYFPFPIRTPPPPGYVAYPLESLALNPQYVPQQPPQQTYAPQPNMQPQYIPQPNMQQPYPPQPNVQQPIQQPIQQPYPPQPNMQQPNVQQPIVQQPIVQQPNVQPTEEQLPDLEPTEELSPADSGEAAPPAVGRECPHCGKVTAKGDALFCIFCGTKFDP